jgi:hypothetical protein
MTVAAVVLLGLVAVGGLLLNAWGERVRPPWGAMVLAGLLVVSGALAWAGGNPSGGIAEAAAVAGVLAAVAAGGPVATAVVGAADPAAVGISGGPQDPDILRGGAWIGVLERAAVAGTLLAGSAEGLVVVIAVKGLGRYSELRNSAAAERFIVGTLASGVWAAACVGVAILLRG